MEAVLKGYVDARTEAGVLPAPENMTQGVKIALEWESVKNSFVEESIDCEDFVMRKLGLHRKTLGAAALPGGFGTLDEIFEVWQRGRPRSSTRTHQKEKYTHFGLPDYFGL